MIILFTTDLLHQRMFGLTRARGKRQMSLCLHTLLPLGYGKDCLVHQGKLVMGIKIKDNQFCKQNSYAIYNLTVTAKNTI